MTQPSAENMAKAESVLANWTAENLSLIELMATALQEAEDAGMQKARQSTDAATRDE